MSHGRRAAGAPSDASRLTTRTYPTPAGPAGRSERTPRLATPGGIAWLSSSSPQPRIVMQRLSSCLLAAVVLAVLPATAGAVLPGNNGHIVFASGRGAPPADDSQAKLFLWHSPRSAAEGDGIVGPL